MREKIISVNLIQPLTLLQEIGTDAISPGHAVIITLCQRRMKSITVSLWALCYTRQE